MRHFTSNHHSPRSKNSPCPFHRHELIQERYNRNLTLDTCVEYQGLSDTHVPINISKEDTELVKSPGCHHIMEELVTSCSKVTSFLKGERPFLLA